MFIHGRIPFYVVTYIDKFGQESNIAYVSPLYYTYKGNRAGSPEESTSNSFVIKGVDLDTSFNYVRVYSIFRTLPAQRTAYSTLRFPTDSGSAGLLSFPPCLSMWPRSAWASKNSPHRSGERLPDDSRFALNQWRCRNG